MARIQLQAAASAFAIAMAMGAPACAETPDAVSQALGRLEQQVADQARQLADQKARLQQQEAELVRLRTLTDATMAIARGAGAPASAEAPIATAPPVITLAQAAPVVGAEHVGEPPPETPKVVIASVPEFQGVLTPRGHLAVEPQIDYQHGSTNRLVFRGVEIVTGIQIGVIDASNADRNATSVALDARYGLTDRIEIEARLPYLYRADRVSTLSQRDQSLTETNTLYGSGIGDVELSARYQFNSGLGAWPIFIGGLRVKSDTGTSPFSIDRDEFGAATKLATGSGFWGLEGSLSFLYPSDPVVLFGGISYLDQFSRDIDKTVGEVHIGRVRPGDSISANAGFGFAVNPKFSFSLGYKHTYIFPTHSDLGGTDQQSTSLQAGQFSIGWSYALTDRIVLTNVYSIGATRDAPDMEVMFRLPIRF